MNEIQIEIIHRLIKRNGLPFRILAKGYTYEDNVVFHIKQLIKNNFISKREDKYFLTSNGLIKSTEIDFETTQEKKFKDLYISFVCYYKDRYLLTSKIYNNEITYKLAGHKPFVGEKKKDYLNRLFFAEVKLKICANRFQFQSEHMRTIIATNDKIIFDNVVHVYAIDLNEAEFLETELKQGNKWVLKNEIKSLKNKWPEIDICILEKGKDKFYEYTYRSDYIIDKFDL